MAPNRHKTRRFPPAAGSPEPSVYGTTWTSLLFVWTWMGSGYAKDPYGEVHLKELIRLQITMYIYICIYMYICIYIYTYIDIHSCIHIMITYVCIYIYISIRCTYLGILFKCPKCWPRIKLQSIPKQFSTRKFLKWGSGTMTASMKGDLLGQQSTPVKGT